MRGLQVRRSVRGPKRHFGAFAPLHRRLTSADARIKDLGREIADDYALLRDHYGAPNPQLSNKTALEALTRSRGNFRGP